MLFLAHLLKMMNINDSMKSSIFISLFVLLCMGTSAQEYDLFLCIGQSNMAGRGYMSEEVLDTIPGVYLFNDRGQFEKAVNPLNRYSTIRKGMELQRVGPSYSFSKMIAVKTGRAVGLIVNARGRVVYSIVGERGKKRILRGSPSSCKSRYGIWNTESCDLASGRIGCFQTRTV